MRFTEGPIPGVWTIDLSPHVDERGWFARAWCADEFAEHQIRFRPVQANAGFSERAGTVRGLHYQVAPHVEAKLVRCTRGAAFDVVVDLRRGSGTFGCWYGIRLTAAAGRMLYLPEGCAHGYQALEDGTEVYYLTSAFYAPDAVRGLRFDDPAVGIQWPLPPERVSAQDRQWPTLETRELDANER
jgi:dTDP-4-dehydrorhamnose 3,5-epimerase